MSTANIYEFAYGPGWQKKLAPARTHRVLEPLGEQHHKREWAAMSVLAGYEAEQGSPQAHVGDNQRGEVRFPKFRSRRGA